MELPARAYRSDLGVRLSTVLGDVARETGETIVQSDDPIIGTAFTRQSAPASRVFGMLGAAIPSWYVDTAGITQVGLRATSTIASGFDVIDADPKLGLATIATEHPEDLIPGRRILVGLAAPLEIATVIHHLEPDSLRSRLWGVV
jgi:hypothetical protein